MCRSALRLASERQSQGGLRTEREVREVGGRRKERKKDEREC